MKRHALDYAARGWRLLPLYWIVDVEGRLACACGNPHCQAPGKHPLVATGRGLAGATDDNDQVNRWWSTWPEAGIAVACGAASGFIVIDCDVHHAEQDGDFELKAWAAAVGLDLPPTRTHETGSGGRHLLWRYPQETEGLLPIRNVTGWLPGVDVKSDGGYVVLPPTRHASGGVYRQLDGPDEPEALPGALADALRGARNYGGGTGGGGTPPPAYDYRAATKAGPRAGARDHFFNARAFELRRQDVDYDRAKSELRRHWERTEQPAGNEFTWDDALAKLDRVYREVTPEPLPDWDPFAAGGGAEEPDDDDDDVDVPREKDTDVGNADRLVRRYGRDLRWSEAIGWLAWDGLTWAPDERERTVQLAKRTVRRMFAEAARVADPDRRDRALAWAKVSESRARIEAMIRLARSEEGLATIPAELDADPWLLTVANGTLDLRTGELREARREDLITKRSWVEYLPDEADDPLWEWYLTSVTRGDDELVGYLRRAAGYTLTGSTAEEKLFIIYGPKLSGKSTFIDGLQTALGPLASVVQVEHLLRMRGRTGPAPDVVADMFGKRMLHTGEAPRGGKLSEAFVKSLTGGDVIRGRHLYKSSFEFRPTFKLWMGTNVAPRVNDDAVWRRIQRVPFPRSIPLDDRVVEIKPRLQDARDLMARTFLRWAVRGCLEWRERGLGTAAAVEADTREYHEEEDVFGRFLEEECVVAAGLLTAATDLHARHTAWCERNREFPMTATAFGIKLRELGFTRVTRRPVTWGGVGLQERPVTHFPT